MRRVFGGLVMLAGVCGLGWVGVQNHALRIQAEVRAGAQDVALSGLYPLRTTVSGRDISVTGHAGSQADFDRLAVDFGAIDGRRRVDLSGVEILPWASPFEITAQRDDGGSTVLAGNVPDEAVRQALARATSDEAAAGLLWASGVPDGDWASVALAGLTALDGLVSGRMALTDRRLTLQGVAMIPADRAGAAAAVSRLPEGYTVQAEIGVLDDGAPFELLLSFDGQVVTASGKVPEGYQFANLQGASLVNDAASSVLADHDGGFSANAAAGAAALSVLLQGNVQVSALGIELTGVAQSPADDVAIAVALDAAAQGADINTFLSYLDDGSTDGWRFDYSVTGGGSVAGTLPRGTSAAGLAALVGLGEISGRPVVGSAADADPSDASKLMDGLAMAAEYLAESETLSFSTAGARATLDMALSHGVDVDLVAADLAQRLPVTLAFTLGTAEALPAEGATRVNSATGQREQFRFGNWLPVLSFVPERDICRDQAQDVLESGGVNFLSASSQLDAKSIRAINTLSVIVQRCVEEGGLSVEVRGHTDTSGGAASNQQLSEERALAVRDALVARGIDAAAIAALGYGQTRPVSDNATEEGRAANRRIEIIWFE